MATYYWVGGSGSWTPSATTNWATSSGGPGGAGYPTPLDDVIFDQAGPYTVTVSKTFAANPACKDFTVTGANVTFSCISSPYAPNIEVYGAFVLVSTTVFISVATFLTIYFFSPVLNTALTTNGATFGSTTFDINCPATSNNGYLLGSDLIAPNVTISVDQGSFNTGGYQVTVFEIEAVNTTSTPSIFLQSSIVSVSLFDWRNTVGTFSAGTSSLTVTGSTVRAGSTRTLYDLTITASNNTARTLTVGVVRNLTYSAMASGTTSSLAVANNFTVTGAFSFPGSADASARVRVYSSTAGTQRNITVGASYLLNNVDFIDIVALGAAGIWNGTNLGDGKNNANINFPAGVNKYWNKAAGGNFNSNDAWASTSGGTPSASVFPLAQDTAVFEATGLNSGATVNLWTGYLYGTIDMSARTSNTMTLSSIGGYYDIVGDWINGTGTTLTSSSTLYLRLIGRIDEQTITSAGVAFPSNTIIYVGFVGPGNSYLTFLDNFSMGGTSSIESSTGIINLNGYTCSVGSCNPTSSTLIFNGGTLQLTGSGTVFNPSGSLTTTPGTGAGTISLTSASSKTFAGGSRVFNCTLNQGGAGELTITGSNTFTNITNSISPASIKFSASASNTFTDFSLAGTAGNLVTVGSTSSTRTNLSKTSGVVSGNYLSISNTNATGGATWYAVNSTDGGNNLGWQFAASDSGMLLWF